MNRKGFTLIELLVTILVISLVLGLSTFGIVSAINSSKEKAATLSLKSVKEGARTYSNEKGEESWKNIEDYDDLYFCVTVEELINKGLLDKNAKNIENNGKLTDYVVVIKDKITRVVKDTKLLTSDNEGEAAYKICTGNIKNEVIYSDTKIDGSESFTDTIKTVFTDAKFESEVEKRTCKYGKSSTSKVEFDTNNNECIFEGLEAETIYYIEICTTSKVRGSTSCTNTSVTTKKIESPTISVISNDSIKIKYSNANFYNKEEGNYYFMSTLDGTTSTSVNSCTLSNDTYNCYDSTTTINKNTWYKTPNKEITIIYNNSGNLTINAETRDKSNNSNNVTKNFSIYGVEYNLNNGILETNKPSIGIYEGGILNISNPSKSVNFIYNENNTGATISKKNETITQSFVGWTFNGDTSTAKYGLSKSGIKISWSSSSTKVTATYFKNLTSTSNEVTMTANWDEKSVTLPTATKTGYTCKWNTKSNGSGISYSSGDSYTLSSTSGNEINLYAICSEKAYIITYNANGGSGAPNAQTKTYGVDLTLSSTIPKRTGYTFLGWSTSSTATSKEYSAGSVFTINANTTLYAVWKINKVTVNFSTNGGTLSSASISNGYSVDSNGIITKNGNKLLSLNYGGNVSSTGLPNYNNSSYLNVTKTDYRAIPNAEWICLSDNCKQNTYGQDINTYTSNSFCDASQGDCTITIGINWEKYKEINDYRCYNDNENYYYITYCQSDKCYYTKEKCSSKDGSLDWDKVKYCSEESINDLRCSNGTNYYITTCTANKCNYTQINGANETGTIDRCTLSSDCTKIMYVNANGGLNCRKEANGSSTLINTYACGVPVKVSNVRTNNYYFGIEDSCYLNCGKDCGSGDKDYLVSSQDEVTCSSGGGSGSSDSEEGVLWRCTCNKTSDCGITGTKIRLWCDTSEINKDGTSYKYKCAWQNLQFPAAVNYCW